MSAEGPRTSAAPTAASPAPAAPGGLVAPARPQAPVTATPVTSAAAPSAGSAVPSASLSSVGRFVARLFNLPGSPRERLGPVGGPERPLQLGEQSFQSGTMLYRADTNQLLVLTRGTGRWRAYPNTWRPGEVLPSAGVRPPGTLDPMKAYGKLWREQPSVKNELGWPVYEERAAVGQAQAFERGTVIRSAYGIFYVLFADGSWRTFADPGRL